MKATLLAVSKSSTLAEGRSGCDNIKEPLNKTKASSGYEESLDPTGRHSVTQRYIIHHLKTASGTHRTTRNKGSLTFCHPSHEIMNKKPPQ